MAKRWRRANFRIPNDQDIAGDRMNTYPMNQFAVSAAILLAIVIVIGMLYAIGVVKP